MKFQGTIRPTDGKQGIVAYFDSLGNQLATPEYYWVDGLITNYALAPITGTYANYAAVKLLAVCPATTTQRTWTRTLSSGTGTVAAGAVGISITNIGNSDAIVNGVKLVAGMTDAVTAPQGDTLGAVNYGAVGTEIIISELR